MIINKNAKRALVSAANCLNRWLASKSREASPYRSWLKPWFKCRSNASRIVSSFFAPTHVQPVFFGRTWKQNSSVNMTRDYSTCVHLSCERAHWYVLKYMLFLGKVSVQLLRNLSFSFLVYLRAVISLNCTPVLYQDCINVTYSGSEQYWSTYFWNDLIPLSDD